jgi:Tol biopolymer transport system component
MKKMIPLIIMAVLVSGCVSESFTGTEITGDEIVFSSGKGTTYAELYLVNDDGSNVRQLTFNNYEDNNPAFSKDKKKIAFHRITKPEDFSTYEIYMMDLETGQERRLTNNNYLDGHPDWSPDGKKVVFARIISDAADLYVIDLASGEETRLTNTPYEENDPEWSPDGTKIAFKSTARTNQTGREEIYVMDADGSNIRRLTETTGWESDHDPSWSSDSKYVYFERFEGTVPWYRLVDTLYFKVNWNLLVPWNVYRVDLEGNAERVTDCEYICWLPVQYNDRVMFLKDSFSFVNETVFTIKVDYATIMPDGTGENIPIKNDEHAYNKQYFDF